MGGRSGHVHCALWKWRGYYLGTKIRNSSLGFVGCGFGGSRGSDALILEPF